MMEGTIIELDKERRIKFTFNSIAEIEEHFGKGIMRVFNEDNVGFNVIRVLLWAGLKPYDKGMTVRRAGDLIQKYLENGGELEILSQNLMLAIQKSGILGGTKANIPEGEEPEEEPEEEDKKKPIV